MNEPDTINLQAWLARGVTWRGLAYQVVEILDDPSTLVLEGTGAGRHIQADAHGRPRRKARDCVLIPLHALDGQLHEDFLELQAANP